MVTATILALVSAVLHASWNFLAKRSNDRLLALWGQFLAGGLIGAVILVAHGGIEAQAWGWAAISGGVHGPYLAALARAYDRGDFSVAYPVARGGGAALAAIGGVVLLGDELKGWSVVAIALVVVGMLGLAYGADGGQVALALVVAATIGVYSTVDGHAARTIEAGAYYVCATQVASALCMSAYGIGIGRGRDLLSSLRTDGARYLLTGAMTLITYGMVLLAARRAPLGYVAALRESSVLVAALVGWRVLDEGNARRRITAAGVIVSGLVLLVSTR